DEYKLADDCTFYIQYPENPFHSLVSRDEFSDYLGRSDVGRLMRFVLDKDHEVTMVYEPYTP
ncbi:MAG: hypothetical protein J6P60_00580, partial [Lachnospiraceae bacterium]|nr:hypothetical protein [Lachnospiraceae bacterium]